VHAPARHYGRCGERAAFSGKGSRVLEDDEVEDNY